LLAQRGKKDPEIVAEAWLRKHSVAVARFTRMTEEMKLRDHVDFATLTVAAQELRSLVSS